MKRLGSSVPVRWPLAGLLVALGALLVAASLTPAAHAQAFPTIGQVEWRFADPPMPIGLRDDAGAVLQPDDESNFRQQWRRTTFSDGTFTLESRAIVARCLKPRETLAPTANDHIVLGNCSDARARWRKEFAPGPGDLYVNVETNHVLTPALCLIQCDPRVRVFPAATPTKSGRSSCAGASTLSRSVAVLRPGRRPSRGPGAASSGPASRRCHGLHAVPVEDALADTERDREGQFPDMTGAAAAASKQASRPRRQDDCLGRPAALIGGEAGDRSRRFQLVPSVRSGYIEPARRGARSEPHGRRCTTSNPCSDARRPVTSDR